MRALRWVLLVLLIALVVLGGVTWAALESGGVAILETRKADGAMRETHVWYVEQDGELWLEAGTPGNGWFVDVQRDPRVSFRSDTASGRFVARPSSSRDVHSRLRRRLAERYGWRDAWVGRFIDQTRSLAVQLEPDPDADPPAR